MRDGGAQTSSHAIGILGIGTYLPPTIRRNDWWPRATIERWSARRQLSNPAATTPAMARVIAALAEQATDPFLGVLERRVMPEDMKSVDMEARAAEAAIASAGIERERIDLLLTHTVVPEYLLSNTACVLHAELGLSPDCLSLQTEAAGYSFMAQLTLAEQLIAGGRARYALLVQSAAGSRLIDPEDPESVAQGDAATAVVVGPVRRGGILASVHRTDGSNPRALIASVPNKRWHDDGRVVLHRADPAAATRLFMESADRAKEVVDAALALARRSAGQVDFFAVHQGTPWLRRVTQETIGLPRARSVDVFPMTGYVFAASIPLVLERAQRDGVLAGGHLVVLHGGGVGSTYGAHVMEWDHRAA